MWSLKVLRRSAEVSGTADYAMLSVRPVYVDIVLAVWVKLKAAMYWLAFLLHNTMSTVWRLMMV